MSAKRQKLELQIEKQLHQFVMSCVEHSIDYAVLSARKKHLDLDKEQMAKTLELVRQGMDDAFLSSVDRFMSKIDTSLAEFSLEENPTQPSESSDLWTDVDLSKLTKPNLLK